MELFNVWLLVLVFNCPVTGRQFDDDEDTMACINISGRLYPPESLWNGTEPDDSTEWNSLLDGSVGGVGNSVTVLNFSTSARPVFKSEIPGIVCMFNPEQMLEKWDLSKNLAMLISYFVIFVIGVVGNVTAMMVIFSDHVDYFNFKHFFHFLLFLSREIDIIG